MGPASLSRLLLLAAIWGGSFLCMRIAAPVFGPVATAFGRVLLGSCGLIVFVGLQRVAPAFHGKFLASLGVGVINCALPFLMFTLAATVLPSGYSAIINATSPLMGVVIGGLLFREPITALKAIGVLLGLAGVVVLTHSGNVPPSRAVLLGVAACLVAAACYGLGGFLTRRWISERGGMDSRLLSLGSQIGAVLALAPVMAWRAWEWPLALGSVGAGPWLAMLALGLVCTSLAYVLYFRLIADIGPIGALTVTFLVPLFALFWGWLILGERASWAHLVGGTLIALALCMVLRPVPARAR
jgi:drug/metabolite transporter (DMT)-like permease